MGDIEILYSPIHGVPGSRRFAVASGSAASIKAGQMVTKALGAAVVAIMGNNKPVVATDYVAGIATSTSTDTAAAAGVVDVMPILPGMVLMGKPKVAATWDTQAEYDALVGDRVLIDTTSGAQTMLATDGATYGCIVEPLDIAKYPGRVAFSLRSGANYFA